MRNILSTCFSLLLSALLLAPLSSVFAQDDEILEEIQVTARKRTESIQDIPGTINVFTSHEIESAGIETPHDFIALTPNVTLVQTQNPGNSFITIRGVSQARNSDMPVAVLVDGVLMSNPAAFNQELFDIDQIEVLKGPQGALYGRNAIGGAITITTKQPTDDLESKIVIGADSGPGYKVQGAISGPVGDSDTLKFRGSVSYKDTDGFLENEYLHTKADPYKDTSARFKLLWEPNDNFTADARASISRIDTTALYFVINDFGLNTGPANNSNDTSVPILANNLGQGLKNMKNVSLKLDYETEHGTLTSITAYDDLNELLTGDAFDFRPIDRSFFYYTLPVLFFGLNPGDFGPDQNQSQYLEVSSVSQEFRFTSPADKRLRWIAGTYLIATDRFIGTGNMADTGAGVFPVYKTPRGRFPADYATDPLNPNLTYLSDSQNNFAWAVFGEVAYDVRDDVEASFALRYDEDTREQTTLTPAGFIPAALAGDLVTGQKREKTWNALQPKLALRWEPRNNVTLFSTLSRGFRSGGFNQSGVALAGVAGVFDTFDQQIADTFEVGIKGEFFDYRLSASVSAYQTDLKGAYYFIFLVDSSTQNLGSLDEVRYKGLEFESKLLLNQHTDLTLGLALTDSEIKKDAEIPHVAGQKAPLSSDYTFNLGVNFEAPMPAWQGVNIFARAEYQIIGPTYWGPGDPGTSPLPWDESPRKKVDLLDVRAGFSGDTWSVTVWGKNAFDKKYNAEFTHPFVWKAPPASWGVDFRKSFQ